MISILNKIVLSSLVGLKAIFQQKAQSILKLTNTQEETLVTVTSIFGVHSLTE